MNNDRIEDIDYFIDQIELNILRKSDFTTIYHYLKNLRKAVKCNEKCEMHCDYCHGDCRCFDPEG